jgi:large subunit ribosomal protein L21
MYAVVKVGGHQEKVEIGDVILSNKLDVKTGDKIILDAVAFVGEDGKIIVDQKTLAKVTVTAEVLSDLEKGKKIAVMRFKNKSRQIKRRGHRQLLTRLKVLDMVFVEPKKQEKDVKDASKAKPKRRASAKSKASKGAVKDIVSKSAKKESEKTEDAPKGGAKRGVKKEAEKSKDSAKSTPKRAPRKTTAKSSKATKDSEQVAKDSEQVAKGDKETE